MRVDAGTQLDFLQLDDLLLLARLGGLFLGLVFVLAVIEDLGNGRLRGGRNLAEVETGLFGQTHGFADGDHPAIFAFGVKQADIGDVDFVIDPRSVGLRRRRGIERWTCYDALLKAVAEKSMG